MVLVGVASGQSSGEFDVASVKRAEAPHLPPVPLPSSVLLQMGFQGGPGTSDPGRIFYHQVSLKMLLAKAYDWNPDRIIGPGWLESEYYTVEAKVPPETSKKQVTSMMQKLLEERFQLKLHREAKSTQIYCLKVAKKGPKLQPAVERPVPANEEERKEWMKKMAEENRARTKERQAAREAAVARGEKPMNSRSFSMSSATMAEFADNLSGNLGVPVRDLTGIDGKYSFELRWNPEGAPSSTVDEAIPGTSIFSAIQEQLGLKLEATKDDVVFLVIDMVAKDPVSN